MKVFIVTFNPMPVSSPDLGFLQAQEQIAEIPPRAAFIEACDENEALEKFIAHDTGLGAKTGLISVVKDWEQWG